MFLKAATVFAAASKPAAAIAPIGRPTRGMLRGGAKLGASKPSSQISRAALQIPVPQPSSLGTLSKVGWQEVSPALWVSSRLFQQRGAKLMKTRSLVRQ
eukprot:16446534-Heterocapsa_arctica.AAC.1